MKSYLLTFLICLGAGLAVQAQETPKVQLTARELFYSAAQAPSPAAAPAPQPTASKKKTTKQTASQKKPAAPATTTASRPAAESSPTTATVRPDGTRIIAASSSTAPAPTAGPALGMRYTILRRSGGEMVPVGPDTVFHSGDRIQFSVETNGPGYLYIVSQGSSGTWRPMFPSADVEDGNNHIEGFHAYAMPPKSRLVFDEQAGTEKIFIVFSRQPEPNLENTIYSLQAPKPQPASQPEPAGQPRPKQLLVASIDDGMVGRLRNAYSRDLIIEKVDDGAASDKEKQEKSVYVVNPTGSPDSRVVADLQLVHK